MIVINLSDLDYLEMFCKNNSLFLNLNKCLFITFSRNRNQINQSYKINSKFLEKVSNVKDLGVIIDSKLLFDLNIESIINSASKMLGFVDEKM